MSVQTTTTSFVLSSALAMIASAAPLIKAEGEAAVAAHID
jgi:hypothetical protein